MTEPCCERHAKLDICLTCGDSIATDETRYYGWRLVAKQTFWGPAEYECGGPFCLNCWDIQKRQAERDEELRSLKGYTDEEKARI